MDRICLSLVAACAVLAGCGPNSPKGHTPMDHPVEQDAAIETVEAAFAEVVAPEAPVHIVARKLEFTEGPAWFVQEGGYLVFSDIPANRLYRWSAADGLTVLRQPSHNANGNTIDNEGRLVTCHHGSREVTRTEADGTITVLASTYKGKTFNSPNDVVVAPEGSVWFTDPPYGLGDRERELEKNYVFRLAAGAEEPEIVADDFVRPNGLCFDPDASHLYIADSDHDVSHIRKFRVTEDSQLVDGEVFVKIDPVAPDGIRVDREGRLYATAGDGVHVFDTEGKLLGKIRLPVRPTNCEFGGAGFRTLFITARPTVYAVELKAAGVRAADH